MHNLCAKVSNGRGSMGDPAEDLRIILNWILNFYISLNVHFLQFTVYKPTKCITQSLLLFIHQPLHMFRSYICRG
jgi:hypothetical protein